MQFQRGRNDRGGYPKLAKRWPDLDTDGSIYISGYGFIHLDPLELERHELKRSASIAGGVMLMLLLLPPIFLIPAQLIVRSIAHWLLANSEQNFSVWNAILGQLRIDLWTYPTLLITMIFLIGTGGRDIRQRSNTAFRPGTAFLAIGVCLGLSGIVRISGSWLESICRFFGLAEHTASDIPSLPAAQLIYLFRTAFIGVILEEFILRGLLLKIFRKHGDAFALMMTSIVSGLIAGSLGGGLGAFVMALMYGYITLRTGSTAVAILCHILCALWPNLLTIFCPDSTLAATGVCTALILIGIVSFSVLCTRDYNAFILSGQSLDYARLSGQKAPTKGRLTFKGKLAAAMTSAFFSASAALWLIRIVRGLTILS